MNRIEQWFKGGRESNFFNVEKRFYLTQFHSRVVDVQKPINIFEKCLTVYEKYYVKVEVQNSWKQINNNKFNVKITSN